MAEGDLSRHGVIKYSGRGKNGTFTLLNRRHNRGAEEEAFGTVRSEAEGVCGQDAQLPWFNRRGSREHVPGNLRYDVLAKSKGHCVACGVSSLERAIEVDHIVPVNMGGSNDISNLQALCYRATRKSVTGMTRISSWF